VIAYLRQLVLHDFWLKLFSLALSILVWVTVSFAIRQQGSPVNTLGLTMKERAFYNLPVVVMSSAEDVRNFKVSPNEIEVAVQGDGKILDKLQSKDIRAIVDLTGVEGARDLRKRIEISTPPGVTHVRVVPAEVQVIYPAKN
jgi:hypothetical protein